MATFGRHWLEDGPWESEERRAQRELEWLKKVIRENREETIKQNVMFSIGQRVTGIQNPTIEHLNEFCIMTVINIDGSDVEVTVVEHDYDDDMVGDEYWVPGTELQHLASAPGGPGVGTYTPPSEYVPASQSTIDDAIIAGLI